MEPQDRELLGRALDVLEDQNAVAAHVEEQDERVTLAKALRPPKPDSLRPTAERIAQAEAVVAYVEALERARVAAVEKWATSSPLARAA